MASLFRLTRQDMVENEVQPFSPAMQGNADQPSLRSIDTPESYNLPRPSGSGSNVFEELQARLDLGDTAPHQVYYTAEFGHLLFDNSSQACSSRVLSLITPPSPSSWPLEHAAVWMRRGKAEGDTSRAPSFLACVPPLAVNMDAGFASSSTEYWSDQLSRYGLTARRKANDLSDIVDLDSSRFVEIISVTYGGQSADLVVELQRKVDENGGAGWTLDKAQWLQHAMADVLVPEAAVDVRLSAQHSEILDVSALVEDEGMQQYLDQQTAVKPASSPKESVEEEEVMEPPRTIVVQGKTLRLVSARRKSQWQWSLLSPPSSRFAGKLVLERAAMVKEAGAASSLQVSSEALAGGKVGFIGPQQH